MSNPWLALEVGADPIQRIRDNGRAHDSFLHSESRPHGEPRPSGVRTVVADSWLRSADAHVDPDAQAPIALADADLETYRAEHQLAGVLPLFRELLGVIAEDGAHLMAICDEGGRLLWVEGHNVIRSRAESMHFQPGACWDEAHAGTNAPGTALALDHPVQIFATEHFSRPVQRWSCAAAPIHDPLTGRCLGAIDITGGDDLAGPQSLALVQATARAAEAHLTSLTRASSACDIAILQTLGRDQATLTYNGRRLLLSRRHSEIMVLLACHPEGLTGDQLGILLHGDGLNPVTLRAEMSRLRNLLGPQVLRSRPYQLQMAVTTDFSDIERHLQQGSRLAALTAYRGPLLPASDAPGVSALRAAIAVQLRASLLTDPDAVLLDRWTRTPWGCDDLDAWRVLTNVLPERSPRRPLARARRDDLNASYASPNNPVAK